MFRITEVPSPGSLVQCLAKNYKNDSIVSVDMDKVDVMAAYISVYMKALSFQILYNFNYIYILYVVH